MYEVMQDFYHQQYRSNCKSKEGGLTSYEGQLYKENSEPADTQGCVAWASVSRSGFLLRQVESCHLAGEDLL